jgi:hypothetical protein
MFHRLYVLALILAAVSYSTEFVTNSMHVLNVKNNVLKRSCDLLRCRSLDGY